MRLGKSVWGVAVAVAMLVGTTGTVEGASRAERVTVIDYDSFGGSGGYSLADYQAKWSNPYGLGEMADGDTRAFGDGTFSIDAAPFTTGADFSVFDHIKYLAISNQSFAVPSKGSVQFAVDIDADTPGTVPGRVVHGTYGPPGSYPAGAPYAATVLEGQQAGSTLHMIDFVTGQLFDWFVAGDTAFTLIERLPSSVTGSPVPAGRNEMYTQIISEHRIGPGPHNVAIRFSRNGDHSSVEYLLDGKVVDRANDIGIPLDQQHQRFTGIYPSLGPGEPVGAQMNSVVIGHGLFSLLDAFPFQHPEAPELSVSIPMSERLFGQGARASFDDFVVTIEDKTKDPA